MKYINSFQINKTTISSAANPVTITVRGDVDSIFSLQIKDSSTPNKFFNFKTGAFTNKYKVKIKNFFKKYYNTSCYKR